MAIEKSSLATGASSTDAYEGVISGDSGIIITADDMTPTVILDSSLSVGALARTTMKDSEDNPLSQSRPTEVGTSKSPNRPISRFDMSYYRPPVGSKNPLPEILNTEDKRKVFTHRSFLQPPPRYSPYKYLEQQGNILWNAAVVCWMSDEKRGIPFSEIQVNLPFLLKH